MRVLYVALTRAKEKCYLLGTVSDASKSVAKWLEQIDADAWLLPAGSAPKRLLIWIGSLRPCCVTLQERPFGMKAGRRFLIMYEAIHLSGASTLWT